MNVTDVQMLGAVVRKRRMELGWSQERAAVAAGVSRPWLSEFEHGKASVEIGLVFATLDVLGLRLNVGAAPSRLQGVSTYGDAMRSGDAKVAETAVGVARTGNKGPGGRMTQRSVAKVGTSPKPDAGGRVMRSAITMGGRSIISARARSPIDVGVNSTKSKGAASKEK